MAKQGQSGRKTWLIVVVGVLVVVAAGFGIFASAFSNNQDEANAGIEHMNRALENLNDKSGVQGLPGASQQQVAQTELKSAEAQLEKYNKSLATDEDRAYSEAILGEVKAAQGILQIIGTITADQQVDQAEQAQYNAAFTQYDSAYQRRVQAAAQAS